MKMNKKIMGAAIVAVVLMGAIGFTQFIPKPQAVSTVQTVVLETKDLQQLLTTDGVVKLSNEVNIFSTGSGMIKARYAKEGDFVTKGQVLLQLDTSDLLERIAQAKYQLIVDQDQLKDAQNSANTVTQASYEKSQLSYERANVDYENNLKLYNSGAISAAELDQYKSMLESARLEVVSAKDKLTSSDPATEIKKLSEKVKLDQLSLKNLEADLADTTIRATSDGQIISFIEESQAFVNAGTQVAVVADLSILKVESMISEYDIAKVKVGQTAQISTLGNDSKVYTGKIEAIEATGTTQNDEVLVKTTLSLDLVDEGIKPNFTVSIAIETGSKTGILAAPYEALTKNEDGSYSVTRKAGEVTEEVAVTKGLETNLYVELMSDTLKAGDVLVIPDEKLTGTGNERQMGPGAGPVN